MLDPQHIIYLDNHLLVVAKPPGLLVQEDHTGDPDLLTLGKAYLKRRFDKPGQVFLGLVHRLDRPASGVMVLARTSKAAARLSEQFRRRTADKRYLAMVEGELAGAGTADHHLAQVGRSVGVVGPKHPDGKRATLAWQALASRDGTTLVAVSLETGRKHQIRVQLSALGHPLVGDFRYGASRELDGRNLALHSVRLTVEHPTRREPLTWAAAPPPAWGGTYDDVVAPLLAL